MLTVPGAGAFHNPKQRESPNQLEERTNPVCAGVQGCGQSPLKTAVLGLDEAGRLLLEAARGLDYFTITAVADSDTNLAQQIGTLWNCAAYDDYRQLIIAQSARLPACGGASSQLRRISQDGNKKEVQHSQTAAPCAEFQRGGGICQTCQR